MVWGEMSSIEAAFIGAELPWVYAGVYWFVLSSLNGVNAVRAPPFPLVAS
jgi:hypothetical protein